MITANIQQVARQAIYSENPAHPWAGSIPSNTSFRLTNARTDRQHEGGGAIYFAVAIFPSASTRSGRTGQPCEFA